MYDMNITMLSDVESIEMPSAGRPRSKGSRISAETVRRSTAQ
jgi:hypothetical protein